MSFPYYLLLPLSSAIGYALGSFGNATAMNIAYSTRGVWSVLLIWIAGQWFMNEERSLGSGVMVRRLIGSGMLLAAVILVILS